jgi:hypothetical protein
VVYSRIIKNFGLFAFFLTLTLVSKLHAQLITAHPSDIKVCFKVEGRTGVKLSRSNSLDSFRWEFFNETSKTWMALLNDSNWSGVNKDSLIFKNIKITNVKVRCVIDSLRLKVKIFTSQSALVLSYGKNQPAIIKSNQAKCFGANSDTLKIQKSPSGGDSVVSNTWQTRQKLTSYVKSGSVNDKVLYIGVLKKTTYVRLKTDYYKCGTSYSDSITIVVYDSVTNPVIGSSQLICYNSKPSTLNIKKKSQGGSDTFKYNWVVRKASLTKFTLVDTINRWQLAPNNLTEKSFYKVIAKSQKGCGDFTSDSITISVYKSLRKPQISKSQTICYSTIPATLTMDSAAKGGNDTFTYQWQSRLASGSWKDLIGASGTTFSPTNLSNSIYYRVKASSTKLCGIVYSDSIYINVLKPLRSPKISRTQIICYMDAPADLKIDSIATGGNNIFSYQWQQYVLGVWQDVGTLNSYTLVLPAMSNSSSYRVKAISSSSCGTVYSDSIAISVLKALNKPVLTGAQDICYNLAPGPIEVKIRATGGNDSFDYKWQYRDAVVWSDINNNKQVKYQSPKLLKTTYFRITAISKFGCGTVISDSIKIQVYPKIEKALLVLNNSYGNLICYNQIPKLEISKFASGGTGNLKNQWYISSIKGVFQKTDDTGKLYKQTNQSTLVPGQYWFKVLSSDYCGVVFTDSIEIKVLNALILPTLSGAQKICYDFIPSTIKLNSLPRGGFGVYKYSWQLSSDNTIWSTISGTNTLNYDPGSQKSTRYYRCVINDSVCGDFPSESSKVTVLSQLQSPKLNFLDSICYNSSQKQFAISFKPFFYPSGGNDSFSNSIEWSVNQINWNRISDMPQIGLSESNLRFSRYYRVKSVSDYGCGTIYSVPVYQHVYDSFISPTIGNLQTKYITCEDDSLTQRLFELIKHSDAGYSFSYVWQKLNAGSWVDFIGETNRSFNRKLYGNMTLRLKVISKQGCGNVLSNPIDITVNSRPDTFLISGPTNICKKSKSQYFEITPNDNFTYLWSVQQGSINKGQSTSKLLVDWFKDNSDFDTVKLIRIDKTNFCQNQMLHSVVITKNYAPQPAEVKQLNGTNILVCSDTTVEINYNWGYFDKKNQKEIIEKKSGLRYYEYIHNIDTISRVYFVKTDLGNCITTSYFKTDIWKLDNYDFEKIVKLTIYPNPSFDGVFRFIRPNLIDFNRLVVYNSSGIRIENAIQGEIVDISKFPKGIYIITDQFHSFHEFLLNN